MLELDNNKKQRERIKVTKATLQERMNNCTNRQDDSLFYVKDKQKNTNNIFFIRKIIISIIIFGILYAMSMINVPFAQKAMNQVQLVYEYQLDEEKTTQVFQSIGGSINSIMDSKLK